MTGARAARPAGRPPGATRGDGWLAAVLGVAAAAFHAPLAFRGVGGCDEWQALQTGVNLAAGDVLYRDVTHIAGPGAFYLAAALFETFGARFEVARVAMLVVFAGMTAAVYLLARRLVGRPAAVLVAGWFLLFRVWTFPHWQMFHYATLALALVTAARLAIDPARAPSVARAALAGLLGGAAFVTKQDSGALGTAAVGLGLLLAPAVRPPGTPAPRVAAPFFAFAAAAAVPALAATAYFAAEGALGEFLLQTVFEPLVRHPLFGRAADGAAAIDYTPFPPLFPLFGPDDVVRARLLSYLPALLWDLHWRDVMGSRLYRETGLVDLGIKLAFVLPYAVVALEGLLVVRARWRRAADPTLPARAAHVVFAAALLAAFSKPRDWIHLAILVFPVAPIVARQLGAAGTAFPAAARRLGAAALAAGGAAYVVASLWLAAGAVRAYDGAVTGPRGRAFARPEDAATLQAVLDALAETPPDRPVLALPCLPIATFLGARPPLTRYLWVWPIEVHPDRDVEVLARLDARPDATVLYLLSHMPFLPRLQEYARPLAEGLAARVEMARVLGGPPESLLVALGRRRPPVPASARRLADRLDEATAARVEDGVATPVPVEAVAGVATWPLMARVVWVAPSGRAETRLAWELGPVAAGQRLVLRAGVHPDLWQALGPFPVRLRVVLEVDGRAHEALRLERDVYRRPEDRGWTPLAVDLGAFAGRPVRVVLATQALGWTATGREIVGFEDPRVEEGAGDT